MRKILRSLYFLWAQFQFRGHAFSYYFIVIYLDQSRSILIYVLVHLTMIHNLNLNLTFFLLKKKHSLPFWWQIELESLTFCDLCNCFQITHSTDTITSHCLHFNWIDFRVKEIMGCKTSYYWRSILSRMFVLLGVELLK